MNVLIGYCSVKEIEYRLRGELVLSRYAKKCMTGFSQICIKESWERSAAAAAAVAAATTDTNILEIQQKYIIRMNFSF